MIKIYKKLVSIYEKSLQRLKIIIRAPYNNCVRFGWTGSSLHASWFIYEYVEVRDGGQTPENSG